MLTAHSVGLDCSLAQSVTVFSNCYVTQMKILTLTTKIVNYCVFLRYLQVVTHTHVRARTHTHTRAHAHTHAHIYIYLFKEI
jgi:hypothetical protein